MFCVLTQEEQGMVDKDVREARALLSKIQGYIVPMPLQFLSKEDLLPPFGSKEALLPEVFQ